jgi:hypothetical protein
MHRMQNYPLSSAMSAALPSSLALRPAQPVIPQSFPPGLSGPLLGASLLGTALLGFVLGLIGGTVGLPRIQTRAALSPWPTGRHGRRVDAEYFETLQRELSTRAETPL